MEDPNWSHNFAKAYSRSQRSRVADFLSDAPRNLSLEAWEYLSLFTQFLFVVIDEGAKEISNVHTLAKESSQKLQGQLAFLLEANQILLKELEQTRRTQKLIAERYKHSQNLIIILMCCVTLQTAIIIYLAS